MSNTDYGSVKDAAEIHGKLPFSKADAGDKNTKWVDPNMPEQPEEMNGPISTLGQVVNTCIGSGVLSFPSVMAQVGLVYMLCAVSFFCGIVGATSLMMIEAGKHIGVMDYSAIVEKTLGRRFRQANDLSVFAANMGALMTYVNVIGSLGSKCMEYFQPHGFTWINTYPGFMVLFTLVFVMPMNFKRSYGELTIVAALAVLFIVAAILFVGIEGPSLSGSAHPLKIWPISAMACVKNMGNFAYSTACQAVVCEANLSMLPQYKDNFKMVMTGAVTCAGIMLASMAIAGYIAFGENVESNVMLSFPSGLYSSIGFVMVVIHLLMYIPNDFIIMRMYGARFFDVNILQVPTMQFVILTVLLFAVPVATMASVPPSAVGGAFNLVLDLSGDVPIGFQCFMLPGLVYLYNFRGDDTKNGMLIAAVVAVCVGGFCMFCCPIVDVLNFVNACNSKAGCDSY